jgi:hypothetical protein
MALRERAALDILARQAHPRALIQQRGKASDSAVAQSRFSPLSIALARLSMTA